MQILKNWEQETFHLNFKDLKENIDFTGWKIYSLGYEDSYLYLDPFFVCNNFSLHFTSSTQTFEK